MSAVQTVACESCDAPNGRYRITFTFFAAAQDNFDQLSDHLPRLFTNSGWLAGVAANQLGTVTVQRLVADAWTVIAYAGPDPVRPDQRIWIRDLEEYGTFAALAARACCDELRTCAPCGNDVCAEHSAEVASCVEVGIHHLTCVSACTDCSLAHAQDVADDLASGYTTERGR